MWVVVDKNIEYATIFTCIKGKLPFKYIGVQVHNKNCFVLCIQYLITDLSTRLLKSPGKDSFQWARAGD
jgi:hypothetical protein